MGVQGNRQQREHELEQGAEIKDNRFASVPIWPLCLVKMSGLAVCLGCLKQAAAVPSLYLSLSIWSGSLVGLTGVYLVWSICLGCLAVCLGCRRLVTRCCHCRRDYVDPNRNAAASASSILHTMSASAAWSRGKPMAISACSLASGTVTVPVGAATRDGVA